MLPEFDLIARCFNRSAQERDDVCANEPVVGIGDDAALLEIAPGNQLVVATDTIVASVHFPAYTPAHAIGYRALAVNLSDLAAMAARPRWASLSITLPQADVSWVDEFAAGFFSLADTYDIALVGGDTVSGSLSATVTLHGEVTTGSAVLRSGAQPGDSLYVTGYPGDAVAGRLCESDSDAEVTLAERFLYPTPRVDEGLSLSGIASAMIDVSDGLSADLGHLLTASGVGAEMDINALPLSAELLTAVGRDRAIEMALTGGDDYELCFAVSPESEALFAQAVRSWNCPVTRIGTVVPGSGQRWMRDEEPYVLRASGFSHFSDAG